MSKVIYQYKHYIVLDTGDELILKNTKGNYKNHSHFHKKTDKKGNINLNAVKTCIRLAERKRTDIKSKYMFEAVKRISTDKDYINTLERLKRKKFNKEKYYFNSQKGVRRW